MEKEVILGTSTIDPRFRVTLIKPLPELLDVEVGDLIVYVKDEKGNIILKSSSISKLKVKKKKS